MPADEHTELSAPHDGTTSHRQILKSSAVIGGSSVITVLLGIVRTKVLAMLIGAEGLGLLGVFSSVTALVSGIAGLGINSSGVRQIAVAVGTSDQQRISRTILVLRRTALLLGLVGMLALLFLCQPISKATFGNAAYAGSLALLSVTVVFTAVAGGQTALVQGLRRIGDLAALSIWGAVLGTVFSLPIIFLYREKGIVPFLVIVSALNLAASWLYARKTQVERVSLSASVTWTEAKGLLGMGLVFMASALMPNAVAYLTRTMVIRQMNLEAAGLFQAAWTLSSVYVGFILGAMSADYYPRLTAVAGNNVVINRLVNEQTEVSLLMAVPGILGTLTFAPWLLHLLYAPQFEPAVDILRWQILGVLGRVIAWPVTFVLMAKGCAKVFFWLELVANLVHLPLIWLGLRWFGLSGLGMAFFGFYVFYGLLALIVVHRLSGFRWNRANLCLGSGALLTTSLVLFATAGTLPALWGTTVGSVLTLAAGLYSLRRLGRLLGQPLSVVLTSKLRSWWIR